MYTVSGLCYSQRLTARDLHAAAVVTVDGGCLPRNPAKYDYFGVRLKKALAGCVRKCRMGDELKAVSSDLSQALFAFKDADDIERAQQCVAQQSIEVEGCRVIDIRAALDDRI